MVLAFYTLKFIFFLILAVPVSLLALALAFYSVNGVPFRKVLANAIGYFSKPNLYIWKQPRNEPGKTPRPVSKAPETPMFAKTPTLTESKLQDLAWSLDIKEKVE